MPLTTNIERLSEKTAVVAFQGPLTLGTSLKFADSQIQGAIAGGVSHMIFDLAGVDYMDSAGLGLMVFVHGALSQEGGSLRLCSVGQKVLSVFQLTKTDTMFAMDESRDASVAALGQA